jgi:hypothetical protein
LLINQAQRQASCALDSTWLSLFIVDLHSRSCVCVTTGRTRPCEAEIS